MSQQRCLHEDMSFYINGDGTALVRCVSCKSVTHIQADSLGVFTTQQARAAIEKYLNQLVQVTRTDYQSMRITTSPKRG